MKKLAWLFPLLIVVACTSKIPSETNAPGAPLNEEPVKPPKVEPVPTLTAQAITDIAAKSSCAAYYWKDRGVMPKAFFRGVALTFAKSHCEPFRPDVLIVAKAATGNVKRDVLTHYSSKFHTLGMKNDQAGSTPLRHVYAILLGLGARESTGRYCCGKDAAADNESADSAEAGAFQNSYDVRGADPVLPKIFERFRKSDVGCNLAVWKEGVTCSASNAKNWGDPASAGFEFQKRQKECPALATEFAAVVLRTAGGSTGHYGPIRTGAAELRADCDEMLFKIQTLIDKNPQLCKVL